jgi:hypothetical protein
VEDAPIRRQLIDVLKRFTREPAAGPVREVDSCVHASTRQANRLLLVQLLIPQLLYIFPVPKKDVVYV